MLGVLVLVGTMGLAATAFPENVTVVLCDGTATAATALQIARKEAARIYADAGITVHWSDVCDTPPSHAPDAARIYLVHDLPKPVRVRFRHEHNRSGLMGYVMTTPGNDPGSVIYVSLERILDEIDEAGEDADLLGRALGRVMAHELAHRFLRAGHSDSGLLKGHFSREDLIGKGLDLRLSSEQVRKLASLTVR